MTDASAADTTSDSALPDWRRPVHGSTVLVTGANRGLGRALARAAVAAGAATVYGAARDGSSIVDPGVVPIELDVTDPASVADAAARCSDVSIVINNAGASSSTRATGAVEAARLDMEVNYFGTMSVSGAFAPVLAANGGGALVNVLSVLSWFSLPATSAYCASKAAAWSLTNGLRVELRRQGTLVVGVHVGYMDTDMTVGIDAPKLAPEGVAEQILDALAEGRSEVLADDLSRTVRGALAGPLDALYPGVAP